MHLHRTPPIAHRRYHAITQSSGHLTSFVDMLIVLILLSALLIRRTPGPALRHSTRVLQVLISSSDPLSHLTHYHPLQPSSPCDVFKASHGSLFGYIPPPVNAIMRRNVPVFPKYFCAIDKGNFTVVLICIDVAKKINKTVV